MSRVAAGTEDQIRGESGKLEIIADRLADKVLEATEWRPEAVRVVLKLKNDPEQEVSWAIPIESPDLTPFTPSVPQGEAALRRAVNRMLDTRPRWANVYNGFVNRWLAPPGEHIGMLDNIRQGIGKADGKVWSFIRLKTRKGLYASFPAGWPDKIVRRKGETPRDDWIGPEAEFNNGRSPFYYLCQLGLDWKKWTEVELEEAGALFPDHFDQDGRPISAYFQNTEDWSVELFDACKRHGLKPVQFTTEIHSKHGLSVAKPKYFFELTPVIVEDSAEDKAFQDTRTVFYELWENLSRVLLEKPKLQFTEEDGKATEDAKIVIKGVMVPIVRAYPDLVKLFRGGVPTISIPVKREDWRTNGLAVLSFVAERLMKEQELFQIVNLDDSTTLLAWAAENVPELADDMSIDEGEEF